jgi:acyl-homoserine-lactone acylase
MRFKQYVVGITTLLLACLAACSGAPEVREPAAVPAPPPANRYEVDIRWTSYGIPHVKANDWGSLGYGFAYATLTDAVCVFAKEIITVRGELSSHFGEGSGNLASDVFHRGVITNEKLIHSATAMSNDALKYNKGFVDGYNRFLKDRADSLPASCAGEPWVKPISEADLARLMIGFGIRYSLGRFQNEIAVAAPPGEAVASLTTDFETPIGLGSNAVAVGRDLSESGRGILLGNPHYPWHGAARFHMIHSTIPGVVDSMGASLLVGNFIGIGFNKDIAWTHTVSTAARFTLYKLEINPDNPLEYRFDGEWRAIEPRTVRVRTADGSRRETIYMSHFGPLLVSDQLPWSRSAAFAMRDAILDNNAAAPTYEALQVARSVHEVEAAISKQGVFFVNTIAADRNGNAFYADISATPALDGEILNGCRESVPRVPRYIVVLDGSRSQCEWRDDPRSNVPGNLAADDMPRLKSRRFVTNSNDSYWLSSPEDPLEGSLPTIGPERTARSLRTRAGLTFVAEQLEKDGKLSPDEVQQLLYNHRHFGAELLADDVLSICEGDTAVSVDGARVDIAESCAVLRDWDRSVDVHSRGTQIWSEFWESARRIGNVFAVPFDVDDPVNTPRGIAVDEPQVRQALRTSLAKAQQKLSQAGVPLDARWGDVQFAERNGDRIPVPGAPGPHGAFSYIISRLTEGKGYSPIITGNSYIQVVSWDEEGNLDARGMLTYSQSPEPDSPHYSDLTELYSRGEWIRFPFTEEEIAADPNLTTLRLTE